MGWHVAVMQCTSSFFFSLFLFLFRNLRELAMKIIIREALFFLSNLSLRYRFFLSLMLYLLPSNQNLHCMFVCLVYVHTARVCHGGFVYCLPYLATSLSVRLVFCFCLVFPVCVCWSLGVIAEGVWSFRQNNQLFSSRGLASSRFGSFEFQCFPDCVYLPQDTNGGVQLG